MKLMAGLILLLAAGPAHACFVGPEHLDATADELIDRTATISLATVIAAEPSGHDTVYTLRTVRAIKGRPASEFRVTGNSLRHPDRNGDFSGHTDPAFWEAAQGRLAMSTDCLVHPSFSVGATYLAFLDAPYHARSFERIVGVRGKRQDRWLRHVLERVADTHAAGRVPEEAARGTGQGR